MENKKEFSVKQFKELLSTFLKNNFSGCKELANEILNSEDEKDIVSALRLYDEELFEEEDYKYYKEMFRSSLLWSVALVTLFGLIAWMV
jgi:hypothetical protein